MLSSGLFEFGGSTRRSAPRAPQPEQQLSDAQRRDLESQLAEATAQVASSPEDAKALEAAAVLNAQLGKFGEATTQLQRLSQLKPDDPDVWRVLGEARLAQGQAAEAAEAYGKVGGWVQGFT